MIKNKNKKAIKVYDTIAEQYASRFDSIKSSPDLIFLNIFLSYLTKGMNIIDLGCGPAFSTNYFIQNGLKAEGVDLSKKMIAIAKQNYPNIKFSLSDMQKFTPHIMVNAVWAGYSLFNFKQADFENTLKKIKSYLQLTGILGIVMQEGIGEMELNIPFSLNEKIYLHLYTKKKLITILERYGFKVINQKIRKATKDEFPYNKILLIARSINTIS